MKELLMRCANCGKVFRQNRRDRKCCSAPCSSKLCFLHEHNYLSDEEMLMRQEAVAVRANTIRDNGSTPQAIVETLPVYHENTTPVNGIERHLLSEEKKEAVRRQIKISNILINKAKLRNYE